VKSNKPYKSLKDVYSESVNGYVAPRRHLRVLGEAVEEETEPDINTLKAEIQQAVDNLSFDDAKEAQYLLKQIFNFPTYKNIKKSLGGKGYSPKIFKKFSNDVQQLLVDIGPEFRDGFLKYLQSDEHLVFPTDRSEGNIHTDLIKGKLDRKLVDAIMMHTGTDEGGRGVGMGELALALIFGNLSAGGKEKRTNVETGEGDVADAVAQYKKDVSKSKGFGKDTSKKRGKEKGLDRDNYEEGQKGEATYNLDKAYSDLDQAVQVKVKGDLEINGQEFEIKGEGATLGKRPDDVDTRQRANTVKSLADMGIKESGKGYQVGAERVSGLNNLPIAISTAYGMIPRKESGQPDIEKQEEFERIFKEFIKVSGELTVTDKYYQELKSKGLFDFNNPASIQNGIALLNFIEYAELEGFKHFMTHDFGSRGPNSGKYVYVRGKPLDMAMGLLASPARFEKVARDNLRPRIGFGNNYAGLMPTSVNVDPAQETEEIDEVEDEEIEYY
jgi:hypothetical protein